MKLHKKSC